MISLGLSLCGPLIKCLSEVDASLLYAATGFVDAEAVEVVSSTAEEVKIVVGDFAVPRAVYERWREVVRVYPGHAGNLYIGRRGFVSGGAPLVAKWLYSGGAVNFAAVLPPAAVKEVEEYFHTKLWSRSLPLTEDATVDAAAESLLRSPYARDASRANEALAEALGGDLARCFMAFDPGSCARLVANALRKRYGRCEAEEVCAAADVHKRVSPRRLLSAPDNAYLAGHPVCWIRSFATSLLENRRSFRSGIEAYIAMLASAAETCRGELKRLAEEELAKLQDEVYRNEAMWTIPYRLLPLALTLPAVGCRIESKMRRDGRSIRQIHCH